MHSVHPFSIESLMSPDNIRGGDGITSKQTPTFVTSTQTNSTSSPTGSQISGSFISTDGSFESESHSVGLSSSSESEDSGLASPTFPSPINEKFDFPATGNFMSTGYRPSTNLQYVASTPDNARYPYGINNPDSSFPTYLPATANQGIIEKDFVQSSPINETSIKAAKIGAEQKLPISSDAPQSCKEDQVLNPTTQEEDTKLSSATGKPRNSYIALISKAILSTPAHRMVLSDIYNYFRDNYSYFDNEERAWRNSVRHNLSLNECFMKAGRAENGKGNYWTIHPACIEDFIREDYRRRHARRRSRISAIDNYNVSALPLATHSANYVPMTSTAMFGYSTRLPQYQQQPRDNGPLSAGLDRNYGNIHATQYQYTLPSLSTNYSPVIGTAPPTGLPGYTTAMPPNGYIPTSLSSAFSPVLPVMPGTATAVPSTGYTQSATSKHRHLLSSQNSSLRYHPYGMPKTWY